MQVRYLPSLTMLIAGAIGCIVGIINHYDISYMMKMELVVMILFFFIGSLAKKIIIIASMEPANDNQEYDSLQKEEKENIDADK